jgi:hypothetical protein
MKTFFVDFIPGAWRGEKVEGRPPHPRAIGDYFNYCSLGVNQSQLQAMKENNKEIDRVIPKGGAWPPPDKQIVMELTSLEWLGVEVGDTIFIETSEGKVRSMQIAGMGRYQNGPPASMSGTPTGFVNRDMLEWLDEARDFNQLAFTVAENPMDKDHIEAVGETIRKKIENSGKIIRK